MGRMVNVFVSKAVYPLIEAVERRHFRSILDQYVQCQYLPYQELKARQEEKMRKLIRHAYLECALYKQKFDAFGLKPGSICAIDDLSKFPITTKLELRQNFPNKVIAVNIPSSRRILDSTSGSTGEPLVFYRDKALMDYTLASFLLFNRWASIKPGDRSVHIGGPIKFSLRTCVSNLLQQHSNISVFDLTVENMDMMLQRLARMRPAVIEGYASAIFRLAQAAVEHSIYIAPKAVVSTSDTLPSKELVEQAFHCPVFNRYGNREMSGALAQNCPDSHSLHINTELCIFEVVDNQGKGVAPGEKGRIVLTDLTNYAMPFIRYDSGDVAIAGGQCSCNRGFPLVSSIEGRRAECLVTPQGQEISPAALGHYLFVLHGYIDYFSKYQAEQKELDRVIFRFVPMKPVNEDVKQRLYYDLQLLMGKGVEINLELVDDIPPEASGKQVIIKSSMSR